MPEISDDELRTLRTAHELLGKLRGSPKTRATVDAAIKQHYPDTVTDEDFQEPLVAELRALRKDFDEDRKERANGKIDAELEKALDKLRADGGYSDEGIDKIKTLMVERKIADPFAAAAYFDKLNPPVEPQKPTSFNGTSWGFGAKTDDADLKLLFDDEDAWLDREVGAVFAGK